jgi:hypothetical protein
MDESKQEEPKKLNTNGYYYGQVYPAVWLLLVGGIFLLNNFGVVRWNAWGKLWPLFIIVSALLILFRPRRKA